MNFSIPKSYIFFFVFSQILCFDNVLAQNNEVKDELDHYRQNNYQEKIYITTDREQYLAGELLWFKVYCLDATLHQYTDLSKVAYVELISEDTIAVLQAKIELKHGVGSGSFYIPTNLNTGKFQLRGYTNWMKNYDEAFFFRKEIEIINSFRKIPYISATSSDRLDLQLFPEGGNLVEGIESQIAFKGVDFYGRGVDFKGYLLNQQSDTLLEFQPTYLGMGSFSFRPEPNSDIKLIAVYKGNKYRFDFPKIKDEGLVMKVSEDGEVMHVKIKSVPALGTIYFLAHSNNIITHSGQYSLRAGELELTIQKNELRDGINHFTLFNESQQPVCERLVFKKPKKKLGINVRANKEQFAAREKVSLDISTVQSKLADLSVSVFKLDSLNEQGDLNILSYLYLTSDLRGKIEHPGYYFSGDANFQDIDLLMLTNGWSRFRWEEILENKLPAYKKFVPEKYGPIIKADIANNLNGAPAAHVFAYLSVPGPFPQFYDAKSNGLGELYFETHNFYGPADIIVQTNYRVDSTYSIDLSDPFASRYTFYPSSPLTVSKSLAEIINHRSVGLQALNIYQSGRINSYKVPEIGNEMFFGNADQNYLLDDYTRFTIMEDVMREYVPGVWVRQKGGDFHFKVANFEQDLVYADDPLILYDGVPIFDVNKVMRIDPLKVKKLEVVTHRYFYRQQTYDGIVNYTTYHGDLDGFELDPHSLLVKYEGLQIKREFYSPNYDLKNNQHMPDFRNLLYWSPDVLTDEDGNASVDFYTSDETGKFLVVVEGLSTDGRPGFATDTFEVKNEVN